MEQERIIANMKDNQKYRITSSVGTDLIFESRKWIPLDFEICTAPIEKSINGIIVVDGALFFKKIEEKISFFIKDGKIHSIKAHSSKGELLVTEYKQMTERDMKERGRTYESIIEQYFSTVLPIPILWMGSSSAARTLP